MPSFTIHTNNEKITADLVVWMTAIIGNLEKEQRKKIFAMVKGLNDQLRRKIIENPNIQVPSIIHTKQFGKRGNEN